MAISIGQIPALKLGKKTNGNFCIGIGLETKKVQFCLQSGNGSMQIQAETHRNQVFTKDFYKEFTLLLEAYVRKHPSVAEAATTVVVADRVVAMDMVPVPTMRKKQTSDSLNVVLDSFYRNREDLEIHSAQVSQNKRQTTFALAVLRREITETFRTICANCHLTLFAVTFASASAVGAVTTLNPHLRSGSYMMMDLKEDYTRITFVSKGRATGYFRLPFGSSTLHHRRLAAEDLLFDHSTAELVVLNAKEKAKAKQLTMMRDDMTADLNGMAETLEAEEAENEKAEDVAAGDEEEEDTAAAVNRAIDASLTKVLPKKVGRKLPKFMLRPQPESELEYLSENFRIFVKWALNLLASNEKLCTDGMIDTVYVRMPEQYKEVLEVVNREKEENGVLFQTLELHGVGETVNEYLELYGGLQPSSIAKYCLF